MSQVLECTACGAQQDYHETDAGHCKACGAECVTLEEIYGQNGTHPDPDWKGEA